MRPCPYCSTRNEDRSLFCRDCGERLPAQPAVAPAAGAGDTDIDDRGMGPGTMPLPPKFGARLNPGRDVAPTPSAPVQHPTTGKTCGICGYPLPPSLSVSACPGCGQSLGSRPSGRTPGMPPLEQTSTQSFRADPGARIDTPVAPALRVPPGWALVHVKGGERLARHDLDRGVMTLGRSTADILFPDDPYLSARHARLTWRGGRWWVEDADSHNGVYVRIDGPTVLSDGDFVSCGGLLLRFREVPDLAQGMAIRTEGGVKPQGSGRERARAHLVRVLQDGSDGPAYPLTPSKTVLGRRFGQFVFAEDSLLSRQHVQFYERDGDMTVEDLGSSNGTLLRIRAPAPLEPGLVIRIGEVSLEVEGP